MKNVMQLSGEVNRACQNRSNHPIPNKNIILHKPQKKPPLSKKYSKKNQISYLMQVGMRKEVLRFPLIPLYGFALSHGYTSRPYQRLQ